MDYIDVIGAGFVPNVPGLYGNCRVYYDTRGVHHIGPLYQEWSEHPEPEPVLVPPEPEPESQAQPEAEPQQDVAPPPPVFQQSNGG